MTQPPSRRIGVYAYTAVHACARMHAGAQHPSAAAPRRPGGRAAAAAGHTGRCFRRQPVTVARVSARPLGLPPRRLASVIAWPSSLLPVRPGHVQKCHNMHAAGFTSVHLTRVTETSSMQCALWAYRQTNPVLATALQNQTVKLGAIRGSLQTCAPSTHFTWRWSLGYATSTLLGSSAANHKLL